MQKCHKRIEKCHKRIEKCQKVKVSTTNGKTSKGENFKREWENVERQECLKTVYKYENEKEKDVGSALDEDLLFSY